MKTKTQFNPKQKQQQKIAESATKLLVLPQTEYYYGEVNWNFTLLNRGSQLSEGSIQGNLVSYLGEV